MSWAHGFICIKAKVDCVGCPAWRDPILRWIRPDCLLLDMDIHWSPWSLIIWRLGSFYSWSETFDFSWLDPDSWLFNQEQKVSNSRIVDSSPLDLTWLKWSIKTWIQSGLTRDVDDWFELNWSRLEVTKSSTSLRFTMIGNQDQARSIWAWLDNTWSLGRCRPFWLSNYQTLVNFLVVTTYMGTIGQTWSGIHFWLPKKGIFHIMPILDKKQPRINLGRCRFQGLKDQQWKKP